MMTSSTPALRPAALALLLAACGGPAPLSPPSAGDTAAATTATAVEPPAADACGVADAGPTLESATQAWQHGLALQAQGAGADARCAFVRAARTLERIGGAPPELVVFGATSAGSELAPFVFHQALALQRRQGGAVKEAHVVLASERAGDVLEPRLVLSRSSFLQPTPWPGVPGGFAASGDATLLVRSPTAWMSLPASREVALTPDGTRALLCNDGTLKGFDVSKAPAQLLFEKKSPARCAFGEFAAGGALYLESSPLVALDPATGESRLSLDEVASLALSPDGATLAALFTDVQNNVPKLRLELRKVSQLDKVVHSREVASLPIWGGGTASVSFDGDGKVEVIWQPVQAVNTYPDPELWAVVDVKTGALLPHKQRVLSGTAKAFEQLAAPFRPQLKDGKRGIINPAPHDATYAAQGPKLAVFTSAELVEHMWGPIVRDVVIAVVDPSSSKVLRRLAMPPSEPTRVHVELGPRGRALFVCLSQLGPFLFDLASGAGGRLGGGSCDGGGQPFTQDGEALLTRDGIVPLASLPKGSLNEAAPSIRLRLAPSEVFDRARKSGDLRELVASGHARCRFGPILAPAEVCPER